MAGRATVTNGEVLAVINGLVLRFDDMTKRQEERHHENSDRLDEIRTDVKRINGSVGTNKEAIGRLDERVKVLEMPSEGRSKAGTMGLIGLGSAIGAGAAKLLMAMLGHG